MSVTNKEIKIKENVFKATGIVHISSSNSLSLTDRKISNFLIANAYLNLLKQETHSIKMSALAGFLGWDVKKNHSHIKTLYSSET